MKRIACAIALAVLLGSTRVSAESLRYEIYELPKEGQKILLAKGTKEYTLKDLEVEKHGFFGPEHWAKQVELTDRFYVGGSVYRELTISGFGLWVQRKPRWFEVWRDGGFSWEWFSRRQPNNVFRKLQGLGEVRVTLTKAGTSEEIAAIEFLDDVTMRLRDHPWFFFFSDRETHHIVVGKGSVLRFAP